MPRGDSWPSGLHGQATLLEARWATTPDRSRVVGRARLEHWTATVFEERTWAPVVEAASGCSLCTRPTLTSSPILGSRNRVVARCATVLILERPDGCWALVASSKRGAIPRCPRRRMAIVTALLETAPRGVDHSRRASILQRRQVKLTKNDTPDGCIDELVQWRPREVGSTHPK